MYRERTNELMKWKDSKRRNSLLAVAIIAIVLLIQLAYPRFEKSYEEIDKMYAINYVDGEYVKVEISKEDKSKVYSILKHSWITVDFFVGDECGADGPEILITYNDGSFASWGCAETDHRHFYRYYYLDKWGQTAVSVYSIKLLNIIKDYTNF